MSIQDRKEREFKRREQEILAAALTLFNRDDWQTMTVERIAQEAEIGKGTVYKHFDSKEEIYARLAREFHRTILHELQQIDPQLDVISRLKAMIRVYWERHMTGREYYRVVIYCARDDFRNCVSAATRQAFDDLDRAYNEIVHPVIAQGIEQGIFPRKPIPLLLFGVVAAMQGGVILAWGGCPTEVDAKLHLETLTNFVLAGLIYQDRRF